jgi:thiamine biosynthesis lipoprotein
MIETIEGLSMGGNWRLRLPRGATPPRAIVQAALDLVEGQMSAWLPGSSLSQINATPVSQWLQVPPETARVIGAGLGLMQAAPGAFSILMGGAQAREGFVPGGICASSADPAMLELDGTHVRRQADIAVDLNAIAKGFAADLAGLMLVEAGYDAFLIEVAGDIVARGLRPDGLPWTVAMELPIPDRIVPARLIPLMNTAIATSGGYRRAKGARSHLLHPTTGQPLSSDAASVAVLARTAMQADGWATVLAVLGPEAGLAWAAAHNIAAAFIAPAPPDAFIESGSPAMADLLATAQAA